MSSLAPFWWVPYQAGPPVHRGGQKFLCLEARFGIPKAAGSHSFGADGGGGGGGGGGDDAARAVLAEERMSARKYGIPKGQAELLGTVRDRKPGNKVSKTNFQGCPRGANGSRIPGPARRDQSACVELRGSPG